MSSSGGNATNPARRPYDAEASRSALLEAASELFEAVGYERATTREIGERAGVDPAMIARYFGSKEGLFLAAIAEPGGEEEIGSDPASVLAWLLERWEQRAPSPISRALAAPALSEEVRLQVREVLSRRVLERLWEGLRERGVPDPGLRAELLVAVAVGVATTRANGSLEGLAATPREEILELLAPLVEALGTA
ncbi:MAG TPA: TetR family transcriptional regulator [Solirubrobacterales bacterium]|nr:TetR family transcriptional regulator [Solirubrobacterales bacterium]